MPATHPIDTSPATLLAQNNALRQELGGLRAENGSLRAKHAALRFELDELKRLLYGAKSERFVPNSASSNQLELFPVQRTPVKEPPKPPSGTVTGKRSVSKRTPVRQPLPPHLPRDVITIEPEGDVSSLKKIGVEVTETLEYVPGRLRVIRRERPKYVDPSKEDDGVVIAALPARLIDKGIPEPGLLAHVLIEKYMTHLPLYRQRERFLREGIVLPTSTLGDWIAQTAWHLTPLVDALRQEALQSGYLQVDETTIPVLDKQKKGKTHRGYYWVYLAPEKQLVVMEYRKGRDRAGPVAFLEGFAGALQTDGYAAYDGFDAASEITTYGCWAHARRHFYNARDNDVERATHVLEQIKQLYAIERPLREQKASAEERHRVRQQESVPILEVLKTWLEANRGLPKSPWGQAVAYSLNRWEKLCRYTEAGCVEIDNNLVENSIRPLALGRKNYLFAGSHAAAQRAALIYSLLGTCKQHGVNPQVWLTDVLSRIPTHPMKQISALLPHHWKALREDASAKAT